MRRYCVSATAGATATHLRHGLVRGVHLVDNAWVIILTIEDVLLEIVNLLVVVDGFCQLTARLRNQ